MTATRSGQSSGVRIPRSPFRSIVGVSCIVLAALPVTASEFGLIPVYDSQKRTLSAYTAFFCVLGFAYVFSLRHGLAQTMFGARLQWTEGTALSSRRTRRTWIDFAVACLILASIGSAATYLWLFEGGRGLPMFPALPPSSAHAVSLALSYMAMFLLAEAALAIIAVREYLQDVLGLSDAEVITGFPTGTAQIETNPSPSSALSAIAVTPGASYDPQVSEFDTELTQVGNGERRGGFLRRIKMTLPVRKRG